MSFTAFIQKHYRVAVALATATAVVFPQLVFAQEEDRQYKIEAAFLYNFFNYITWPGYDSPQAMPQSVICLYGNDPVEPYLDYIQRKKPGGRQIEIRQLKQGDSAAQCQIVFLRDPSESAIQALAAQHILVVTESDSAANALGMINLFQDDERLRMRINEAMLEKSNFQVSSRLLNLAQEVIK